MGEKYIYLVVSETGTWTSKLVRAFTKTKYCHVSVSLDKSLETMYAFGRRLIWTPLFGGFIKESPTTGVFKRFPKTDMVLLRFSISEAQAVAIKTRLEDLYAQKKKYKYNYIGAFLATFRKPFPRKRKYYCSEFVQALLEEFLVCPVGALPKVVYPEDFIKLFPDEVIYRGYLQSYVQSVDEEDLSDPEKLQNEKTA